MEIKSLAYRTDLFLPAFEGEIIDRGHYLVIRTPATPSFYWGNFLLFEDPPQAGDLPAWKTLFAQEIGTPPTTVHQVFGWDSPRGDRGVIQPFLEAGFRLEAHLVLTSRQPPSAPRPAKQVRIRALESDRDWEEVTELQVMGREPEFTEQAYRRFQTQQNIRYRKMIAAGWGTWYGAYLDQQLVGDLGFFHHQGLGCIYSVETHPDFRRRGIASTLVCEAARQSWAAGHFQTLVIVADEDSAPARLYESLGFLPTEKQVGLCWWPEMESGS